MGESYVNEGVEDVVFCYLRFPSGLAAHMHLSWLDPHKERRFTVVGSKRMATFDDMELERKLTLYDKGFDEDYSSYGEYIARSGDIFSPRVPNEEPLRIECRHFLDCIAEGVDPRSDGESGLPGRAGAGGAAVAAGKRACCARLSARRGCSWARASSFPRAPRSAPTWWCIRGPSWAKVGLEQLCAGQAGRARPRSSAQRGSPRPAAIGAGARVGAGAVVLAGARVGERAVIADQARA